MLAGVVSGENPLPVSETVSSVSSSGGWGEGAL